MLYARPDQALKTYPAIQELFLSHDKRSVLYQVILKDQTSLDDAKRFVREIGRWKVAGGLELMVGGQPVYYNDFDQAMARAFPVVIGFIVAATFLMLAVAFRSFLIPIKAILMNLLSVGAGLGAMVAVFLTGRGSWLVGLAEPTDAIPQSLILIIFCVVFGLSMDYEVFLLSRMKEVHDATGDNRQATVEGLAHTGSIITSAALVMTLIFGAFAWAEMVLVKMLGFGLAVAVLVDATVIRCVAVPAFMRLAGRWNWYPGAKPRPAAETAAERVGGPTR
jgi:RND superfamily putative drug exporter